MKYEFRPEALAEYEEAARYYAGCQEGLELRFNQLKEVHENHSRAIKRNIMKPYCLLPAILGLLTQTLAAEVLHYNLLPGSTITPYDGSNPTGPTEPLAGHLDWVTLLPAPSPVILSFDAVGLAFQSESFTLVLDRTTVNDVASPVHTDSQYTTLSEVADLTGFDISVGYVSSISPGTYYGPANRPVVLRFPDVRISPIGGGVWRGVLNLLLAMDGITINVAPGFAKGPDLVVAENSGPQVVSGWATGISAGPAGEAAQTLTFRAATDNDALFSVLPAIAPNGTLTFTPAPSRSGVALVTLVLKDDGGTAYGGQDTSPPQSFTITVLSPCQAVWQLEREVRQTNLPHFNKQPLLASLEAAARSFERGDWLAGINQLQTFQRKVQTQLARIHPALAQHWITEAQEIIDLFARPLRPGRAAPSAIMTVQF